MEKPAIAWLVSRLGISPDDLEKAASLKDRMKLQKAAHLLGHLGVKPFTKYGFSLYIRGPYSPGLARDYYGLKRIEPETMELDDRVSNILEWFISHDLEWLEVASSIISIHERYPKITDEEVFPILRLSKPWVTKDSFVDIMRELRARGLPR